MIFPHKRDCCSHYDQRCIKVVRGNEIENFIIFQMGDWTIVVFNFSQEIHFILYYLLKWKLYANYKSSRVNLKQIQDLLFFSTDDDYACEGNPAQQVITLNSSLFFVWNSLTHLLLHDDVEMGRSCNWYLDVIIITKTFEWILIWYEYFMWHGMHSQVIL